APTAGGPGGADAARSLGSEAPGTARSTPCPLTITAAQVYQWADATGDRSPIHLRAGAARRAGLDAGATDVVVHGLFLGALSLALVPAAGCVDLRFPAPAVLPEAGAVALNVGADGGLSTGVHAVLVRR
ncbi:MaoC/PaaZ C-terminal domain-containing protein, partial [Actinomyces sp. MRS3W]|uniref:MaoC/PaaZ C-terminal domain-containing protein n=1 Tax=Actinomyces sp. MRS3W TaxID=2800796 RepID=UPI0028FD8853